MPEFPPDPEERPPGAPGASAPEEAPMETVDLEELGAGRDMSAGNPDAWEILPMPETSGSGGAESPPAEADFGGEKKTDRFLVKLDVFEGPIELLLHLVREHKLNIHDIPIAFITDQYIKYLEMMRRFSINVASEYLVMASWLVYIKSRTLLPQTEEEDEAQQDAEALRLELQRQLIEYQKFKSISQMFRTAEEEQMGIYTRGGNGDGILLAEEEDKKPPRLSVTMFDLLAALGRLIEEAGEHAAHLIDIDELEIADRQTFLLDRLEEAGGEGVTFHGLFPRGARVLELVATFLALLELIRRNLVRAHQDANFSEIRILKAVNDD